jgi:hypothetical protein
MLKIDGHHEIRCILIADDMSFHVETTREVRSHPLGIPVSIKVGDPDLMATLCVVFCRQIVNPVQHPLSRR